MVSMPFSSLKFVMEVWLKILAPSVMMKEMPCVPSLACMRATKRGQKVDHSEEVAARCTQLREEKR